MKSISFSFNTLTLSHNQKVSIFVPPTNPKRPTWINGSRWYVIVKELRSFASGSLGLCVRASSPTFPRCLKSKTKNGTPRLFEAGGFNPQDSTSYLCRFAKGCVFRNIFDYWYLIPYSFWCQHKYWKEEGGANMASPLGTSLLDSYQVSPLQANPPDERFSTYG